MWWVLTRGFVLILAVAMMFHHDWKHVFDDLNVYAGWGVDLAAGQVPADDPMWQYPPLAAFVFAGVGLIGSEPWLFTLLFVAVDAAIGLLLTRDAARRDQWSGLAVWLAAPVLLGPILYGRYDSVPTLAALAGLLAIGTPVVAGAILAIGGGLKVWPAVMALALSQRGWFNGALGAVSAAAVIVLSATWAFPGVIGGFLGNGGERGLQTESVAALPFVWARLFVGEQGVPESFRYGSSEIDLPVADAIAPWLIVLTALGLLVLILLRALGRLDHAPVADIAFVAILWLMVTSRVLSPQFNIWLVGMAALVWAAGSARMRRATIPVAVTAIAAQALYPFSYIDIIEGGFIGTAWHTVRIVALVCAMVLAVRALYPQRPPAGSHSAQETNSGTPTERAMPGPAA